MKKCARCKTISSLDNFPLSNKSKDGRASWCKPCKRVYDNDKYKKSEQRRKQIRDKNNAWITKNKEMVWQYLLTHPCVDCGETDPVVLEFDHRKNKINNVSTMIHKNAWKTIEEEIKKCDIRCANCHRRKTAKQFNYYACIA